MIYVIKCGEFYKIGYTSGRCVEPRIKALQTASPHKLETIDAWEGGADSERRIHDRFAHLRVHGEWFRLTERELSWLEGMGHVSRALYGYPKAVG